MKRTHQALPKHCQLPQCSQQYVLYTAEVSFSQKTGVHRTPPTHTKLTQPARQCTRCILPHTILTSGATLPSRFQFTKAPPVTHKPKPSLGPPQCSTSLSAAFAPNTSTAQQSPAADLLLWNCQKRLVEATAPPMHTKHLACCSLPP
jgi:hypothetical protein